MNFALVFLGRTGTFLTEPVVINGTPVDVAPNAKLLDLSISKDLKWNARASDIVRRVATPI